MKYIKVHDWPFIIGIAYIVFVATYALQETISKGYEWWLPLLVAGLVTAPFVLGLLSRRLYQENQ